MLAADLHTRSQRLGTLTRVREQTAGVPADARVASAYARLAVSEIAADRRRRVHDTWIAATALADGVAVWTQDTAFTAFAGVDVVRV
jgi:predicted nucleic acid-binding protein